MQKILAWLIAKYGPEIGRRIFDEIVERMGRGERVEDAAPELPPEIAAPAAAPCECERDEYWDDPLAEQIRYERATTVRRAHHHHCHRGYR